MSELVLVQTLSRPVQGYWDGGAKQTFEWTVQRFGGGKDKKGEFVRVGSWEANHWFCVSKGKTERATLMNAKRRLMNGVAKANRREAYPDNAISCTFEVVER